MSYGQVVVSVFGECRELSGFRRMNQRVRRTPVKSQRACEMGPADSGFYSNCSISSGDVIKLELHFKGFFLLAIWRTDRGGREQKRITLE